jgi:tRNA (guanine26-N2/guanine27-N2)-dimethyltransferase
MVPDSSLKEKVPPRDPAFFNPLGALKRDLLVAIVAGYAAHLGSKIAYGDPLAGVGAGSIRVCNEVDYVRRAYVNDLNPDAIELAKTSAKLNRVYRRCSFSRYEANDFLSKHSGHHKRLDCIELDPFGSPAQFLESAVRACKIKGMVSATATDGAVLCGVHPETCFRKYGSSSLNTEYCHEIAVRILYAALAFAAMRLDLGISPVFSHTTKHYAKVNVIINAKPVATSKEIGYISHCSSCGARTVDKIIVDKCQECKKKTRYAGPLWIGELFDKQIVEESLKFAPTRGSKQLLEGALSEIGAPKTYFVIDKMCDNLGIPPPPLSRIIDILQRKGFMAVRTILNPRAIRTGATVIKLKEILKSA